MHVNSAAHASSSSSPDADEETEFLASLYERADTVAVAGVAAARSPAYRCVH